MGVEKSKRPVLTTDILGADIAGGAVLSHYDLQFGSTLLTSAIVFVDGVTWYLGHSNSTTDVFATPVPKAGTITAAFANLRWSSISGTAEPWSMYIDVNGVEQALVATVAFGPGGGVTRTWSNDSLNIPVAAGDLVIFRFINPTWATNPTSPSGGPQASFVRIEI